MTQKIEELKPTAVWNYFHQITQVPRPSKKEEKIIKFLLDFCKKNNIEYKTDKVHNIVALKAATPGMENRKKVVLQGHVDMVCEKNKGTVFDFDNDAIKAYVDGDWVKAEGTTLGADNGIAVAMMMAVLTSKDIAHGPIECLFTVDEETGLTGANNLDPSIVTGEILINIDTEDEGVFTVGCAGGMDTMLTLTPDFETVNAGLEYLTVEVKGLHGGHSGVDINKGRANAIKFLSRLLNEAQTKTPFKLVDFHGGNLRNAIAREAQATIALEAAAVANFKAFAQEKEKEFRSEFAKTEEGIAVVVAAESQKAAKAYSTTFTQKLLKALVDAPHGVLKMSAEIPTLVQTSTNLASVKPVDGKILISTSQRSAITEEKFMASDKVISAFSATGASVNAENKYPGWEPNFKSPVLELFKTTYKNLFKREPVIEVIHAGLECGILGEKKPGMDMISFGPTIKNPHSPAETVQVSTVGQCWQLLVEVLKNTPKA